MHDRVNIIKIKSLHMNIELSGHDAMHTACVIMISNMQHTNLACTYCMFVIMNAPAMCIAGLSDE